MWDFVFGHSLMAMLIGGSLGAILWFFLMRRRLKTGFIGVLVITALCMVWGVFWLKMFAILEARIASVVNGRTYEPGNMSLFGAVFF